MSRPSKIGRLPAALREELNRRLAGGEAGPPIVDWLNSQPGVRAMLEPVFQGFPVSEQNLSDWRRGGYAEWEIRQEFVSDTENLTEAAGDFAATGISAGHFLACLKVRYASNLLAWDGSGLSPNLQKLQTLQRLYNGVLNLRRNEQQDEKRALDRDRLDFARERHAARRTAVPKTPRVPSTETAFAPAPSSAEAASNSTPPARPTRRPIPIPPPALNPPAPASPPLPAQTVAEPTLTNPSLQPHPPVQPAQPAQPAQFVPAIESIESIPSTALLSAEFDEPIPPAASAIQPVPSTFSAPLKALAAKITPPYKRCLALAGATFAASPTPPTTKPSPPPTPAKPSYHRPPADPEWFRGAVAALMACSPEDPRPARDDNDPTLRYPL